jgi:hypothetical protein
VAWTSPRTWVAGEVPTASTFNTHVRDNLKAIGDAWAAYTPTISGWTLGNGTLAGYARQAGKDVRFRIEYTVGSTDTISGQLRFALPTSARWSATPLTALPPVGQASLRDVSAPAGRARYALLFSASSITLADESFNAVTNTVPWTWATGDLIVVNGSYEAA